jgi:hypothetical protein
MSKGSKQRPCLVSDLQMQSNWDKIFSKFYKVYVWPDGSWIGEDDQKELEEAMNESDDFYIEELSEIEYNDLCEGKLVL